MTKAKLLARKSTLQFTRPQLAGLALGLVAVVVLGLVYVQSRAAGEVFTFASFADTKTGTSTLAKISPQVASLNPAFVVYPGDLCDSGPTASCFANWKSAMNGNNTNNLFDRVFATRGNHDSSGSSVWSSSFNFAAVAARIGATNFTGDDFTYSFDYGNSHFIGLDSPGGSSTTISASQVTWVDNDLRAAEARGVTHSFAFWHGPVHPQGGHCCTDDARFIKVLGSHRSFAAVINGHEHNTGITRIDSRWGNTGHPFYTLITGAAGAGLYACKSGRADYCISSPGFAIMSINGRTVKFDIYQSGRAAPVYTASLTNDGGGGTVTPAPTPQTTPTPTPAATSKPRPTNAVATPAPTPAPTSEPSATPAPEPTTKPDNSAKGDADGNGKVDIADLDKVLKDWGKSTTSDDFNKDGKVNIYDLSILLSHWTQ